MNIATQICAVDGHHTAVVCVTNQGQQKKDLIDDNNLEAGLRQVSLKRNDDQEYSRRERLTCAKVVAGTGLFGLMIYMGIYVGLH
jgi:hypothetical protein